MIRKETVFIVGAGASKDLHLPLGTELRDGIASDLRFRFGSFNRLESGSERLAKALQELARSNARLSSDAVFEASRQISMGLPLASSIDEFIDSRPDDSTISLCGKAAIAENILSAERQSLLKFNEQEETHPSFSALSHTWLPRFFNLLANNCSKETVLESIDNTTIICFNYDRTIQKYILHALEAYFNVTRDEALSILRRLKVYRPYGSLGFLREEDATDGVPYGAQLSSPAIIKAAEQIRTFSERTYKPEKVLAMKNAISNANQIVFLGFGFHKMNMEYLSVDGPVTNHARVYATALGISDSDCEVLKQQIYSMLNAAATNCTVQIDNSAILSDSNSAPTKCALLFDQNKFALSS